MVYFFLYEHTRTSVESSQRNEIDMESTKTILSIVKSLQIPISRRKTPIINRLASMALNYIKLGENLTKPDQYTSRYDAVASRTDIRHPDVTKMSDVIKKYVCHVIFEKNARGVLPQWALCPTLPYWHLTHSLTHYALQNVFSVNKVLAKRCR